MELAEQIGMVAGLILLPAVFIVLGGLLLGWLEARQIAHEAARRDEGTRERLAWLAWTVPFAALTALLVLAPVVVGVWAVVAAELAAGYLATVGFGLGALLLGGLAAMAARTGSGPPWHRVAGVLLSSAVGFAIVLMSYLGRALAGALDLDLSEFRSLVPIAVALLIGGLAIASVRRSRQPQVDQRSAPELEAEPLVGSRTGQNE